MHAAVLRPIHEPAALEHAISVAITHLSKIPRLIPAEVIVFLTEFVVDMSHGMRLVLVAVVHKHSPNDRFGLITLKTKKYCVVSIRGLIGDCHCGLQILLFCWA